MTSRPWPLAVPPGTTPRHGRRVSRRGVPGGGRGRRALVRDPSVWVAAGVVTVAVAGGVGTASLLHGTGAVAPEAVAVTGLVPAGAQGTDALRAGDAAERSGLRLDAAEVDSPVAALPSAGPVAVRVDGAPGLSDVRPLPLPQVVDRDTVGPLWLTPVDEAAGLLSLEVVESAGGVLDVVPGSTPPSGPGRVRSVRVEVERGLPVDGPVFAETVMRTLGDPRSWGARGEVAFARTDGPADIRVVLASPRLVDALCAPLDTGGQVSCGRNGHAALNFRRWVQATPEFADREQYRQYLVNHEVGHLLGHPHESCPGAGRPAPLMQQQSLAVAPCEPNGWPYPQG